MAPCEVGQHGGSTTVAVSGSRKVAKVGGGRRQPGLAGSVWEVVAISVTNRP